MISFSLLFLLLALSSLSQGLHEDQIGKFDWHQKLLGGPVKFVFSDPVQPKRILVGTENNVIAALHANDGHILYRVPLESGGGGGVTPESRLLYYGLHSSRQTVSVSLQQNLVRIRLFNVQTGIKVDEWAVDVDTPPSSATLLENQVFLFYPTQGLSATVYNLQTGATQKTFPLSGSLLPRCQMASFYLVCREEDGVSILHLEAGYVTRRKIPFAVKGLSVSGYGPIPAFVVQGSEGQAEGYILVENKDTTEFIKLDVQASKTKIALSQFSSEEPLLFITRLEKNELDIQSLSMKGEVLSSAKIRPSMPILSLKKVQGFSYNGQIGLVGVTKDELMFGTLDQEKISWTREESLSSVLQVEMVDYPSEVGPTWNPYLVSMNVVRAFFQRIKYEIESTLSGESLYASDEDRFGLRKVIVYVTKIGKVIGMDSSTGQILYTFLLPEFSLFKDQSAFLYIQRPAKYTPLKPQACIVYPSATGGSLLVAFDPVEGKLQELKKFPEVIQTQMLHHAGEETNFVKPVILLGKGNDIYSYPQVREVDNYYFFVTDTNADGDNVVVRGVKAMENQGKLRGKQLWSLSLGPGKLQGVYGKLPTERVHSQGRVLPDRTVSYKYMNPNLVVVVTAELEAQNINLWLVDAVSGSLIHSFWHKKSRGPVHVVHSEHWLVYSLFNEKNRRYELSSVELYEGQSQSNSSAFSSFGVPPVEPIIVKQSYIFPTAIQHLAHTRSEKGITNKDILIALPTGGILELPRLVVQPRLTQQHYIHQQPDEDGVIHHIPYQPELPILSEMIFNYNQSVRRVDGIKTWPTRLESTCLVLVHGSDLYYTKLTPSKTFDILKDDFDHWIISLALAGLTLAAYGSKKLAQRKQLDQAWK